jgi:hypothetical protein
MITSFHGRTPIATCVVAGLAALLLLGVSRDASAKDEELGRLEEGPGFIGGFVIPERVPPRVFRDAQGSYYWTVEKGGTKVSAKPEEGAKFKYKDEKGNVHTVKQPRENVAQANADLQDYANTQFASLSPVNVDPGDVIYALEIPAPILSDILALQPALFGTTQTDTPYFFSSLAATTTRLVLGALTPDGDTPTLFSFDVGAEWMQVSFDFVNAFEVVSTNATVDGGTSLLYSAQVVPEPSTVLLFASGLAVLAALGRKRLSSEA